MKLVPPDTRLKDHKKRRSAFLQELIASTPNVSVRAKEFRRWIDENALIATMTKSKTRPRCPRCKLRVSKRSPVACPNDAEISCLCCDHCRRECALDAKRSQLKRS
jgi:hypothetical protein